MSKHSVIILGLRVITICWSWAWTNRTSPSNGVGLGNPLAACSVYGDLTCSVHTVHNLCLFNCQWHAYLCNWGPYVRLAYMPNMLSSWNKVIIISIIIVIVIILINIPRCLNVHNYLVSMSVRIEHTVDRQNHDFCFQSAYLRFMRADNGPKPE